MINGYIGGEYIDGAHWYLTYLILFDIIISIIALIEKKYSVNRILLLVAWIVLNIVTNILSQYVTAFGAFNKLLGGQYIVFIMLGIVLKELFNNKEEIFKKQEYIFLFVLIQILNLFTQNIIIFIGIEIFLIIFVYAIIEKIKILDCSLICCLGDISYIAYLLHQNIGYQIILGMIAIFNMYLPIYTLVVMAIILMVSYLIYRYYEIPVQSKISGGLKRFNLV